MTSRDSLIASLRIDIGLEVNELTHEQYAEFLLQMASMRRRIDGELDASRQVAEALGGLPLALNQMAALINARNWSIAEFQEMYAKHKQEMHKQKKGGWKYLGYKHALDTVFEISFNTLGNDARVCLGVLSFYSADSVPDDVFTPAKVGRLPDLLSFCKDKLRCVIYLPDY